MAVVAGSMALVFAACGGGRGDTSASPTTVVAGATTTAPGDGKLPQFASEFERVCNTQVGFPGAHAYEGTPGVMHPVALFEDYRGEGFLSTSRTLPAGWAVKEDTDYKNNSELAAVELVACSDRVKETPTGKQCEFDSDGKKVKLELVDATFELKIYTASTGKGVGTATTLEARSTDCPYIAAFKKGDTKFVTEPSDDDYINALKAAVAP